jgi:catechol-2,3-dioxygenase
MKRFHVHVAVENIENSIRFYSALFGAEPSKRKTDYAKWMLEDPRLNFAISARGAKPGLDHFGFQVDSADELGALREQMKSADLELFDEGASTCCYAASEKSWTQDPGGIAWESYHTMEDAEFFNESPREGGTACCAPKPQGVTAGTLMELPIVVQDTVKNGCC